MSAEQIDEETTLTVSVTRKVVGSTMSGVASRTLTRREWNELRNHGQLPQDMTAAIAGLERRAS